MKTVSCLFLFLSAALLFSSFVDALAPSSSSNRRNFLSKVASGSVVAATVAVTTATTTSPVFAASSDYALDGLDEVATKKDTPAKKSGDGGAIVGGALAAGFALSLPFFAPNLARMAGVKNAKQPPK